MLEKCVALGESIEALGAATAVDMDEAGMRLTLDIVAQVSTLLRSSRQPA